MKESISGETIFEEFIEKIEWNKEAVAVQNLYTPAQISLWRTQTSKNAGYIKMIAGKSRNGDTRQHNIGRAVDEDNRGDLNSSLYSHRKSSNGAIQEHPYKKIGT